MTENEMEIIEPTEVDTEPTENNDEDIELTLEDATDEESAEELKKRLATAIAQKEHWRKKATQAKPQADKVDTSTKSDGLSIKDLLALTENKVSGDDIDEVVEYAKFKKISISEALKSPVVKATLAEKSQIRASASAAHTGNAKRGSTRLSEDALLDKARNGDMPDSEEDIARLWKARKGLK